MDAPALNCPSVTISRLYVTMQITSFSPFPRFFVRLANDANGFNFVVFPQV
jgi:hypothetical protein